LPTFGATGGVVRNLCVQEATYIKKGAKEIHDFLIPKICTSKTAHSSMQIEQLFDNAKGHYDGRTTLIERLNASKQALAVLFHTHCLMCHRTT
jgi:hypothetical protein